MRGSKIILVLALLLSTSISIQSCAPKTARDANQGKKDPHRAEALQEIKALVSPSGSYGLDTEDGSAAFENIDHISITSDGEGKLGGEIFVKEISSGYEIQGTTLAGRAIAFETLPIAGVSFQFVGNFLIEGNFAELKPKQAVLAGHIIKRKGAQKVAEGDIKLKYLEAGLP